MAAFIWVTVAPYKLLHVKSADDKSKFACIGVVKVVKVGVNVAPAIVVCFPLIAFWSPVVLAMLREPSVMVGCFPDKSASAIGFV